MGWTGQHEPKGRKTADIIAGELNENYEILRGASVGSTFYAAVKDKNDGSVTGLVVLTQRDSKEYFNFNYKFVDENMGPNESECPAKILDLLTPTSNDYANEWRDRCRAHVERVAAFKSLKPGDEIELVNPLRFTNGCTVNRLRKNDGGWTALHPDGNFACRVPSARSFHFVKVA